MGVNDDTFNYFNEQNRRINANNYQASFPMIQALEKVGGVEGEFDFENAIGDYSASPVIYEFPGFTTADSYINEIHITIIGSSDIDYDEYGSIDELTNGVTIALFQNDDFRFVSPAFKVNHDYQRYFNGEIKVPGWKKGNRVMTATLKLDVPVILKGGTTDFLAVQVNDDFTGLIGHHFTATGFTTNLKEFQGA